MSFNNQWSENDDGLPALTRGDYRVEWVDLGEGLEGDFDPSESDDEHLLRFEFSQRNETGDFIPVDDASYCTAVSRSTPADQLKRLLEVIMGHAFPNLEAGLGIKKVCERMSWINERQGDLA